MSSTQLKMLDVCCGMGGVSEGFAAEGYAVTGIDIENAPEKLGYKFPFIQGDITKLNGKDFRGYNVIWGSTPCRNFTKLPAHGIRKNGSVFQWKTPKDPKAGLLLVNAFLKFVEDAQPTYWILENVSGLAEHQLVFKGQPLKPRALNSKIKGGKRHVFYGNFPPFLIPQCAAIHCEDVQGPNRSWIRAKIPLSCSRAFAKACKSQLVEACIV